VKEGSLDARILHLRFFVGTLLQNARPSESTALTPRSAKLKDLKAELAEAEKDNMILALQAKIKELKGNKCQSTSQVYSLGYSCDPTTKSPCYLTNAWCFYGT
jgi:hypothetical protein